MFSIQRQTLEIVTCDISPDDKNDSKSESRTYQTISIPCRGRFVSRKRSDGTALKVLAIGDSAAGQVICAHLSKFLILTPSRSRNLRKVETYVAWLNNEKVSVQRLR